MSEAYVFYRHKAKPQYRLVLKEDAPFPSGTSPDQWVDQGHRLEDNVSEETCAEVARHGFKLYRLAASFEELQPSLDELKHYSVVREVGTSCGTRERLVRASN